MQPQDMKNLRATSYLSAGNADYIEELYDLYLQNPQQIAEEWRQYFNSLSKINGYEQEISHEAIRQHFLALAQQPKKALAVSIDSLQEKKQTAVERLIDNYRRFGHLAAKIDPLDQPRVAVAELQLAFEQLEESDLAKKFSAATITGVASNNLQEILNFLRNIYCSNLGFEFMHISNRQERHWWQQKIENTQGRLQLTAKEKLQLLHSLTAADGWEKYLASRFVGQKRFSLEGGDTLIPILKHLIHYSSKAYDTKEIVIGMAHRGRLNVLVNIFGKPPSDLFAGFEGKKPNTPLSGDVKYHAGYSSDIATETGQVHLSLAYNPSHLEIVSPVAIGSMRARQDNFFTKPTEGLAVTIHGDAAFAGQGVVMEMLNMSQLNAYQVGGAIRIVVNNQVGFTTSDLHDVRSTTYATDIAKMLEAPVIHVNGDDPEAALFAIQLAVDYRAAFHKDIIIDLVCFRRHGHNEADEPAATQPLMYQKIKTHFTVREIYAQRLQTEKVCTAQEAEQLVTQYRDQMDQGKPVVNTLSEGVTTHRATLWEPYLQHKWQQEVNTAVSSDTLSHVATQLVDLPKDFEIQRQVGHMMTARAKMLMGELPMDWGCAETLAYATLLQQGYNVRMTGQDCRRGTFAHRHAVLHDQQNDKLYTPLQNLKDAKGKFAIYDSLLSEAAVLAFEYGYSATDPNTLVLWEAQYGDFANGAQVVIDQFISSAWQKWGRLANLVMLLPHGYEGAGPEHSSARLERYLQLCAQNNMQVCNPTTPAQIFHLLRRQMLQALRIPLIIMSPKSLLRNKQAVSSLEQLKTGTFKQVLPEHSLKSKDARRVVFCSGKVYYDLLLQREAKAKSDVAVIRLEQLYPFPMEEVKSQLKLYKQVKEVIWCQEEPQNQGAWYFVQPYLLNCLAEQQSLAYAGREASAATATGYASAHNAQQEALIESALQ